MRLFPTVHATGDLPPAHRAHLERHGLTFVGADDDPDVVLVLPGTAPRPAPSGGAGVVVARDGRRDAGGRRSCSPPAAIVVRAASATRPTGLVPADLTADDLLAWTTDVELPVRATLDVDGPAVPLLRTATGSQALGRVVAAGCATRDGALLVLGVDPLGRPRSCSTRASGPRARRPSRRADDAHGPTRGAPRVDAAEAGRHRAADPAGQGRLGPGRRAARPRTRAGARDRARPSTSSRPRCRTTRTT